MKKLFAFVALWLISVQAIAEEGMWPIGLIGKNIEEMQRLGLKLSADDIYNINKSSLKDGVVSFGGYCTGELVSEKGLLFTNHHCGFESIQQLSSVADNFIDNGYFAKNQKEELKVPGLFVDFFVRMESVTDKINEATKDVEEAKKSQTIAAKIAELNKAAEENGKYRTEIKAFYKGNEYYLFIYQRFNDVRLVLAPPSSIGNFGGDTDNWMWPRHTGDFSVFRVYADKNNNPAEYSEENVPYKPKHVFEINTQGISENDYAMTIGFPGSTNRYLTPYAVNSTLTVVYPALVECFGAQLAEMRKNMDADEKVKIMLASKYASKANGWKLWSGQTDMQTVRKIMGKKNEQERVFKDWANKSNRNDVIQAFDKIKNNYAAIDKEAGNIMYTMQLGTGVEAANFASQAMTLEELLKEKKQDKTKIDAEVAKLKEGVDEAYKEYHAETDKKILARMLELYTKRVPAEQQVEWVKNIPALVKSKNSSLNVFENFAEQAFASSNFVSKEKFLAFLAKPNLKALSKDLLYQMVKNVMPKVMEGQMKMGQFRKMNDAENKLLQKAMQDMEPNKAFYPDANFTQRVSFGQIKGMTPRDGMQYDWFTTIDGIMAKENPNDREFKVPAKLSQLYNSKDFGNYTDKKSGKLQTCFLSTNDITGGNSGSPVIDGNGRIIGIAFDGNWEGAAGDLYFDKNLNRTISVDIRYVLFTIDKFGGCGYLLNELKLK